MLKSTRFQTHHPDKTKVSHISDLIAKKEFVIGAKAIAFEISNSAIKVGDSYIRYAYVQSLFQSVLKILSETNDFESDLFQLSVEGGVYCGTGKVEAIEDVYKRRVISTEDIPLKHRFYHQMMTRRRNLFEGIYQEYLVKFINRLPKGIIDPIDIHFTNLFRFYLEESLRMNTESLKNDMTVKGYCDRTYRKILTTILDYTFWPAALKSNHWYSPADLVQEIVEVTSDLGFSKISIVNWWNEWLEKQKGLGVDQEVENIGDEFSSDGTLFKKVFAENHVDR